MSPSALALLISALCAAGSSSSDDDLAALTIPVPLELLEEALPPAPTKVVLKTSYFGSITLDHQAHLKRRVHCRDCHGPGPVSQIDFTPKLAHDRCRGCHQEIARGPTDCKGCHVKPPQEPALAAAASTAGDAGATGGQATAAAAASPAVVDTSGGPWNSASLSAGGANPASLPPEVVLASAAEREAKALHRTVQVGASAGSGYGLSVRLASRQGPTVMSFGLDRLGGSGPTRTTLLIGTGGQLPVRLPPTLGLFAEGVAGLDAVASPKVDLMPAVGGRLGLEWTPRWSSRFPFLLSVTGLLDAFQGSLLSPACLFATIGVGAPLQPR